MRGVEKFDQFLKWRVTRFFIGDRVSGFVYRGSVRAAGFRDKLDISQQRFSTVETTG